MFRRRPLRAVPAASIMPPSEPLFGSHVDQVVGAFHHVEVVFDHHHGVAFVDGRLNTPSRHLMSSKCSPVVGSSSRNSVRPVSRLASSVASFTRWFASGECRRGLAEFYVSGPDVVQYFYLVEYGGDAGEEFHGLVDGHVEHVGYRFAFESHFRGVSRL